MHSPSGLGSIGCDRVVWARPSKDRPACWRRASSSHADKLTNDGAKGWSVPASQTGPVCAARACATALAARVFYRGPLSSFRSRSNRKAMTLTIDLFCYMGWVWSTEIKMVRDWDTRPSHISQCNGSYRLHLGNASADHRRCRFSGLASL